MSNETATHLLAHRSGGTISDLAETAGGILDQLGKPEDTLASANDIGKRIRLIRDYAQRGILSDDAERRGKELFYAVRHLNQLVGSKMARQRLSLRQLKQKRLNRQLYVPMRRLLKLLRLRYSIPLSIVLRFLIKRSPWQFRWNTTAAM